ncbi:MAG: hypothetical protein GX640_02910 [Fibrobacter sp.]|nr:hypothetical protein [Fibrobacter sp.]
MSDTLKSGKYFDVISVFEIVVGLFFLLILCVLLLGFFPFSHSWLDKYALETLKRTGVENCSIGKVHITLWKGIDIRDLKVTAKDTAVTYTAEFSKVKITANLLSSFMEWRKNRTEFDILSIDSLSNAHKNPLFANTLLRFASDFHELIAVEISCRKLVRSTVQNESSELNDFIIKMNRNKNNEKIIETRFIGSHLKVSGTAVTLIRGDADLEHGVIRLKRCRGRAFGGKFKLIGELDCRTGYLNNLSISATGIDIQSLVRGYVPDTLSLTGLIDFDLTIDPGYFNIAALQGKGVFHLSHVQISNSPVVNSIYQMLEIANPVPLSFSKVKINLQMGTDKILQTVSSGSGEMLDFKADGWIQPTGDFSQQVDATISAGFAKQLSEFIATSLEKTSDGGRVIRCRIYGNSANPKVELDKEIMKNAVNNVFRQMKESIQEFFKKN